MPDVTLVKYERGVGLVGLAPSGGDQYRHPSTLWLTQDGRTWRNVTPPLARVRGDGDYPVFEQSSFLDARTGWVTLYDEATVKVTVLATTDGGRHWRTVAHTSHSLHAGTVTLVQLVSRSVATMTTLEPTGPGMDLSVTTDAGRTWRDTWSGPQPHEPGEPLTGPFETGSVFVSATHAFAADGIPPTDPVGGNEGGALFRTADGGRHWTRVSAPLPASGLPACRLDGGPGSGCLFALPQLEPDGTGTLVGEVVTDDRVLVDFDTTRDGGRSWTFAADITVSPVAPTAVPDGTQVPSYALVGTPTTETWWVVAATSQGASTWTSHDTGRSWEQHSADLPGQPSNLQVLDANRAWLTMNRTTSAGSFRAVYMTVDRGRSWKPLRLS